MLVNAIYDHGKIIWQDDIELKNENISIVVDVPDDVISKIEKDFDEYKIKNPKLKKKWKNLMQSDTIKDHL